MICILYKVRGLFSLQCKRSQTHLGHNDHCCITIQLNSFLHNQFYSLIHGVLSWVSISNAHFFYRNYCCISTCRRIAKISMDCHCYSWGLLHYLWIPLCQLQTSPPLCLGIHPQGPDHCKLAAVCQAQLPFYPWPFFVIRGLYSLVISQSFSQSARASSQISLWTCNKIMYVL